MQQGHEDGRPRGAGSQYRACSRVGNCCGHLELSPAETSTECPEGFQILPRRGREAGAFPSLTEVYPWGFNALSVLPALDGSVPLAGQTIPLGKAPLGYVTRGPPEAGRRWGWGLRAPASPTHQLYELGLSVPWFSCL